MSFPISITWSGGAPPVGGFQQMAQAAGQLDTALSTSVGKMDQFAGSIGKIEGPIGGVATGVGQLESSIGGLEGSIGGAASGMESFAGSTETVNGSISETGGFVTEATSSLTEFGGAATEAGTGATTLGTASTEANTGVSELGSTVTSTVPTFADMATGATDSGTAMTELTTATTDTNTALGESVTALGDVVPGLQDTATGSADSAQGFSDLAPKVDETNTALDSSSGLLSGVAPLLADTGTNAGEAATTTGDFSGAMAGLGEELGPVNGGLTSANTLVGDVGGAADTTAGQTTSLKDSMATLAFGLTTVVGAGYGLVNSFLAIRDAGFKVEAANLRAEKSATTLDKAVLAVGKSINKLATDSEAPIKGMGNLQKAFADFQKLIAAGIISGPQYAEALNALKVAADGLEGSTTKDNNSIAALNIQIDQLGQKAQKADLDARKLTKSFEAQTKAYVDAGMSIATLVGGMGSMIQTITSAGAAAGLLKGAFVDLGIVMSQSVIPVLASIAVPVGIAIAAIVGFVAAVTAIRANIKVFDDMGIAIGKVFPGMVPMLQAARQAFINFSDAINSSVSVILGGIDSLTGGTLKLKEHWDGFTDTLPKGTANVNVLTTGMAGLSMAFMDSSLKAKLTTGQFKIVGDSLVRLSDGAKIGAGSWTTINDSTVEYVKSAAKVPPAVQAQTDSLTAATTAQTAMGAASGATGVVLRKQTADYSELTNAQKLSALAMNNVTERLAEEKEKRGMAILEAQKYLSVIKGINPALFASGAAIVGVSNALSQQEQKHFDTVVAATEYIVEQKGVAAVAGLSEAQILKLAAQLKEEAKASGQAADATSKHAKELQSLRQNLADNAAELAFYANASEMANRMQLEFNLGVQDAELKLNKRTFALARSAGELQRNMELLAEGLLLEVAYGEGVIAAGEAVLKKSDALAKAIGQYDETNRLIEEENLLLLDMQVGYQEARTAVQAHTEALAKSVGALQAWNDEGTRTREIANQVAKGWVDAQTALQDMAREAANAVGEIASLRQQLEDSGQATVRFNQGLLEGRRSALEWAVGLQRARGEALGFRDEVLRVADDVGVGMQDMSHLSTEAIQNIIEVAAGIPAAFEETLGALESFGSKFVDILTKAGEEGKVNVMENIDQLEEDLNVRFSEPMKEKIKLEADRELVNKEIETLMGGLATTLMNNPLKVQADTLPAQGAIQALIQKIDQAGAAASHLAPLRQALVGLSQVDMTNIHEFAPALARVVQEAKAAGEPFDGLMAKFQELGPLAQMSASELDSVSSAFKTMGLNLNTTTGIITDSTGVVVGEWGKWGVGARGAETEVAGAMGGVGAAGDAARDAWARDMQIMFLAVDQFGKHAQVMAGTVSGAFSNMAANTHASMSTMAQGFIIILTAMTRAGTDSQRMAQTVSGSFSNMANNTRASMNTMASGFIIILTAMTRAGSDSQRMASTMSTSFRSATSSASSLASGMQSSMSRISSSMSQAESRARSLQSAINALKSKTITITTVYVTIRRTIFAAKGGAFVTSNPTNVGPVKTSEFGQAELVTVTPLQTPGRQAVPGLSSLIKGEQEKKGKRMMAREAEEEPKGKPREVVMMRETPIIVQVDGREIARVVNKRIFEESDALV